MEGISAIEGKKIDSLRAPIGQSETMSWQQNPRSTTFIFKFSLRLTSVFPLG
jgi:hypothetical protein